MNDFRDRILGRKPLRDPLLRAKSHKPVGGERTADDESLAALTIPRSEGRQANHRKADRHRLADEDIELFHAGACQRVTLINLSGGGAMVEGAEGLKLWDRVELRFSEWSGVEGAVRWVRGKRIGLEFAHETRVEAEAGELRDMLRSVIQRSFPDVALANEPSQSPPEEQREAERDVRHPLIWSGEVHYNHDSIAVRLRNISAGGALVQCPRPLPVGAELLLDLGKAGTIFATVHWSRGDSAGLKFHAPFEVKWLAAARPQLAAPSWSAPDYIAEHAAASSPWASQWRRSDLGDLHRRLGQNRD